MAGITLEQAEAQLASYLAAETKVLAGQSYEIAGRKLPGNFWGQRSINRPKLGGPEPS